jgi:carboxymethylenebutenolidase
LTLGRSGSDIEFSCDAGSARAYLALPPSGRGRGVLVVDDAPALGAFAREVCDRLARAGWTALTPELPGAGAPDAEGVAPFLDGAVDALLRRDATDGARVGVVGFGAAGPLAVFAAARNRRVGAAIDFYGAPQGDAFGGTELSAVAAPILCIFGDADAAITGGAARDFEAQLTGAGARVRLLVLPGAGPGFMNEGHADRFDAVAAAAAWDAALAFLAAEV